MQSQACPPPLTWWGHAWRYAVVLAISAVAWFSIAPWQWEHARWWFWTDLALGIGTFALLPLRRRYPVSVALVSNVATVASWSSAGPATLALASMSTRRRLREIIPVGLLGMIAGLVLESNHPVNPESLGVLVPIIVLIVAMTIGWGMYVGSRRELMATLRERAESAESEQAARLAQARTAERTRIAREMHDVLAHRISLVTMHAGALSYRDDLTADQIRATASIIQDSAHEAMVELREVLGLLRDGPGDSAPELPQPSAVDLPSLLAEARRSGMRIEDQVALTLDSIPESLGRTVYRVVQEGLTNARKHAPDTLVAVRLAGDPASGLTVTVNNPIRVGSTPSPASGLGLVGLSERTALAGGHLTHRISPDRDFVLRVWLPWPA